MNLETLKFLGRGIGWSAPRKQRLDKRVLYEEGQDVGTGLCRLVSMDEL